ncbi:MAG TPA: pyrroloquinoline-quinone synthase PqqC [Nitrospira sp.]|nr:pyrroloquinoline-quinone synthase PqqC [Nitrospira sp.]
MTAFEERVWRLGFQRYHHEHPFHVLMHDGKLTAHQLQQWVLNRYYYQTRIPIKDALILSKSEDLEFRRMWSRRLHDQDGDEQTPGGLALWRRLAYAVGIPENTLEAAPSLVLPGVQFACDAYVSLVREATLVEAVAASLTELFAPTLMSARIAAWERHYPWVDPDGLAYFRSRLSQATRDSQEALAFVLSRAVTTDQQDRCVAALLRKTEILWHILDCLYAAYVCRHCESRIPNERCEPSHVAA